MVKLKLIHRNKKSQAWGIDLIIAFTIFSIGIVFFYFYALNNPNEAKENIETLSYEGKVVAASILSEGHPTDWNSDNVIKIGILNNNKINEAKLEMFYNLAETDYAGTKIIFNTRYDYYFFLDEPMIINAQQVEGIGLPPSEPKNLIKITRFTIYQNKSVTVYLYIWEQ